MQENKTFQARFSSWLLDGKARCFW
jgi:hypothetical protein